MKHRHHNHKDILIGVAVGATVGALTTLLFGTEKGKKLQKEVVHKIHQLQTEREHFMQRGKKFFVASKKVKRKAKRKSK